jgi:membrane peptidoglycan carboxypeptidase
MSPRDPGAPGPSAKKSRKVARRARRGDLKPNGKPRTIFWRMRRVFFAVALVFVLGIAGAGYLFTQVPLPEKEPPLLQTSFFCAADVTSGCNADNSLAQLSGSEDRISVTYDQLPPVLVQAVLAAEDRTFYDHGGVDPVGIVRALWANLRSDSVQQGGSTITQQYVKNVYLSQERTLTRKVKEAALAVKLERELPKQEILTRYLNTIYFGRGAYGVEAASRAYFGKSVGDVTLPEAAYLAGLIRSPETADAQLPPEDTKFGTNRATAVQRRNSVLKAMVETGDITQAQYDEYSVLGWDDVLPRSTREVFGHVSHPEWGTEYFRDYVRHWLVTPKSAGGPGFTDAEVLGGGLRVYTTLDMTKQEEAMDAVTSTLNQPGDPAAALVSIDETGAVRAMIGGTGYDSGSSYAKVNLAVGADGGGGGRQAGSSFKMFTLAEAMSQGIPLTKTYNAPAKITIKGADGGKDYVVGNYADAGLGTLDLVQATAKSSNTAYVQLMQDVGPANVVALAKRMGITSELNPDLSLTLGTADVSVLDMASAYSTLADGGQHRDDFVVSKVTDAYGNVLYEHRSKTDNVLSDEVTANANYALSQVVEGGTGTAAKIGQPVAGKTGTTENYRDAWFAGFTCKLTTVVWMGYPDANPDGTPKYMKSVHGKSVTGGSFPTQIWQKYMAKATEGLDSCPFPRPAQAPATASTGTVLTGPTTSSTSTPPSTAPPQSSTTAPPPSTTAPTTTSTTTAPTSTTPTTKAAARPPG